MTELTCREQIAPSSNALTEGIAWLFEALRATSYFDEQILRSHERLPMPERAKMARAYYDVLPPYEQILIYRAASLPNTFYRRASVGKSNGMKIRPSLQTRADQQSYTPRQSRRIQTG
jgi:hypothetical protein